MASGHMLTGYIWCLHFDQYLVSSFAHQGSNLITAVNIGHLQGSITVTLIWSDLPDYPVMRLTGLKSLSGHGTYYKKHFEVQEGIGYIFQVEFIDKGLKV
jgi:hypothetical protein